MISRAHSGGFSISTEITVQITFHQALFGYDGGHQLLAASVGLPTNSKHFLAVATDLSGTAPRTGFERAYTGLPVPGTEYYALFATWLAPEMPRPGCVWSHVLLIDFADLALLPDLGELRRLFRRPVKPDDQAWRNPICFSQKQNAAMGIASHEESIAAQFLEALYVTPAMTAVKEVDSADSCEDLVFAIWSQQWPRLRRSFRFSTGSFADRGRGGATFDLQLTSIENLRAWKRTNERQQPGFATALPENSRGTDTWLPLAIADLCHPDARGFRTFLRNNGLDVSEPRAAYARLATAYRILQQKPNNDWLKKLKGIGLLFPEPLEALRLKQSVVVPSDNSSVAEAASHAWASASFLFSESEAYAYTEVKIDYARLAPLLWKNRKEDVLSLLGALVRQEETPAAVAFVVAIASILHASDLVIISERYPEAVPILISHRPSLAFEAETWQLRGYIQSQIFEVLDRMSLSQADWARVLGAMLSAGTYLSVRDVQKKAGPLAMRGALSWLEHPTANEVLPSHSWREMLSSPASALLKDSTDLSPSQLVLAAWCAPFDDVRCALFASREDVQRLAKESPSLIPPPLRGFAAFLLVTLGLREDSDQAENMVLGNFFTVYEALASGTYSPESWWLLSPELPGLGWWRDWDRCKKLRKAVYLLLSKRGACTRLHKFAETLAEKEIALKVCEEESDDSGQDFID